MVLMSDTGGGHRASAEALQAGFEQLYGNDFQVSPLAMLSWLAKHWMRIARLHVSKSPESTSFIYALKGSRLGAGGLR